MRFLLLILFVSAICNYAQNVQIPPFQDLHSRELFGNYLFQNEDYLRAKDEFSFLITNSYNLEESTLKSAICYRKLRKYDSTFAQLSKLGNFDLRDIQKAITFIEWGKSRELPTVFNKDSYFPDKNIGRMKLLADYYSANSMPNLELSFSGDTLKALKSFFYDRITPPEYDKNVATLLSVFVPGLGKAYLGQYTEGFASLLAISLFSYLSVHSFNHENTAQGVVFTSLTSLFYIGNVYGTYAEAMRLNNLKIIDNRVEYEKYIKSKNYFQTIDENEVR